jgi:hypothetical protein
MRLVAPRFDGAEFVKVDEGELAFVLGVEKVEPDGAEDALGVEDFEDAAFAEAVGDLGGGDALFGLLEDALFESGEALGGELIAAVGVIDGGEEFELAGVGEGLGLAEFSDGFGDGTFAAIPEGEGNGDADTVGGGVGRAIDFGAEGGLGADLGAFEGDAGIGTADL